MITVVIKDDGEDRVTQLTYEQVWRELKNIPGADLQILRKWSKGMEDIKNKYICFLEADCLLSSGYFTSQLGLLKKDPHSRKLAMLSSVTCVNNWANRVYGYKIDEKHGSKVTPILLKRSSSVDTVQIAYLPGAVIRVSMLETVLPILKTYEKYESQDLVFLSTNISLAFWRQGEGNRVNLNPNSAYVTTEDYVNDIGRFTVEAPDLLDKFKRESI